MAGSPADALVVEVEDSDEMGSEGGDDEMGSEGGDDGMRPEAKWWS